MDIYQEILSSLESEEHVMLATVIATGGSTPAAAFSKMLVKQGGTVSIGTVGGGCMEGDVQLQAHRLYDAGRAEVLSFTLTEDDNANGLICGGTLDVLVEPITRREVPLFTQLKNLRDEGIDCIIGTMIDKERRVVGKKCIHRNQEGWKNGALELTQAITPGIDIAAITDGCERAFRRLDTVRNPLPTGELFLEPQLGAPSLIVFGGGHVSKDVVRVAAGAGFRCTVIDDREMYAHPSRFPDAVRTLALDFSDAVSRLTIGSSTYVLIITRGHQHDESVLEQIIRTPARYIGMIGSKRKVLTIYDHLMERGISTEALRRVHAPVGLELGAMTPGEIAVSIVAELIRVRRIPTAPLDHKSHLFNKRHTS